MGGAQPFSQGAIYSPDGAYIYDNAVYLKNDNQQYPGSGLVVDNYGLLFTETTPNLDGDEINIWANGNGTYEVSAVDDQRTLGSSYTDFDVTFNSGGITTSAVPEPSQAVASFMLLGCGALVFTGRRLLKKQAQ